MSKLQFARPDLYTCDACLAGAYGSVGFGHFGERIETLPAGWRRAFDPDAKRTFYVCSAACADKCVARKETTG